MRKFKTESKKLLDLMINSIYTNREIFLRELISNASDAIDKLYFRSLTDTAVKLSKSDLAIRVAFDKETRTVTVSDNGIGMSKDDLDRNLGTIAHSDSLEFKNEIADAQTADAPAGDVAIIGQFGVGFYSGFMVAAKVRVVSRAYGANEDEACAWESDGVEGYTIDPAERTSHGTDVILTLKSNTDEEDYDSYVTEYGLKRLVKHYSNYVRYPIQMEVEKSRELPKPDDAGDDYKPEYEQYRELETINSMVPIWKRPKNEVTQEEYNEFYKSDFHDSADPVRTITLHAEGSFSYDALLFVPGRTPFDLYSKDFQRGLALYSSNVLIMEKCEELLPDAFNFVRGVVDSQDLTLNISRETLQHNSQLRAIAKRIEKKIESDLADMLATDREAYEKLFADFGRSIKFGIYSSYGMKKDGLANLLLFYSAQKEKMLTLDEYLDGLAPEQESIFYAAGESVTRLAKMPVVSSVCDKGYDVLLCTDDIDEFCLASMFDYKEKPLKNVAGGDLGLETEEEKTAAGEIEKDNETLFAAMKEALG
ncbi:MAG: molecular chaperone HtpG, partial [Coriobacteriales bacterium]|nr:molecular chaperone HtpG [Coriobacteriales bacterium]